MEIDPRSLVGEFFQNDGDGPGRWRQGRQMDLTVSQAMPNYSELASRKRIFGSANQTAQAVSVALNTTYTGHLIYNPVGSGIVMVPLFVGITLSLAPAAIATIGLLGAYSTTADPTGVTALTPYSSIFKGATGAGVGKAASAATIGTPIWVTHLMGGFTAAALPSTSPQFIDFRGSIILPPGAFIGIGALTAVTGLFSFLWAELPTKVADIS
jgi:hypothetical protein